MTTTRPRRYRVWREILALPVLLSLGLSAHAQVTPKAAAPEDTSLQEVVVTGSRIARPEFDNLEPTATVDSKTFDQRGYLDVGQALSELPAFGVQPSSAANTQAGFGVAQSFIDLYGLGSQRTLTLVNGRRFVSSSTASLNNANANSTVGGNGSQVDLNVIPTKLIDHVDAISVGGAPIYGADAIAGAVNIILKKDYQGLDVDAMVGASGQGDAWNYRARVLGGQNMFDGRANVTVVAEMTKTDGLVGTSRPVYSADLGFLAPATPGPFKTVLTAANAVPQVDFGGVPMVDDVFLSPPIFGVPNTALGVTNGSGQLLTFGPNGSLIPYNTGVQTGNPIFNSGGDGLRLSTVSNLLSPTERINLDTLMHFQINDHINAFGEGYFSETHATNLLSQPAYNAAIFGQGGTNTGNFVVSINNPYLTPGDRALIQAALNNYAATLPLGGLVYGGVTASGPTAPVSYPAWNNQQFYVSRASTDLESGRATATQTVWRGVTGLNGDFAWGQRNFNWEVAASYGTSSNTQVTPSYVFQNVVNALNATTNAQGQIVCGGTPVNAPIQTASSTCAPLNIFGRGSPSEAALQYITHLATAESFNTQRDVTAFIAGDLIKLPAGEWKASAGYENRRETANFAPDSFYTGDWGNGSTVNGIEGSYITNEAYVETLLPVFSPMQDIPMLHRVELEAAARRVDNSIAGNATTYTYGARWSPIEDVQFRGNKTKSIRAPSITELFLPAATSTQFANDPCDKNFVAQGSDPAQRAANCAAAGINTATFVSNVVNATVAGTTSGNTALQSEVAFSKTFGVVLRPRFVPKLNISVDYIDIALKDAIQALTLVNNLDACYDATDYPNNPSCSTFTRNPATHQITNFHAGFVNAGLLEFTGIQAALDYTFELPWALGNLETTAHYLDTQRLKSQVATASPNELSGSLGGPNPGPAKSKGSIDLLYVNGGFSWDWQGLFIGRMNFNNQNATGDQDIMGVGHWWLINSTLAMKFTPQLQARFIVDNVFNKQPPLDSIAGTGGNFANATSQYFSGIIGRALQISVDYKFY